MGEREHGSGEVIMFPLTPDQRIPETLETLFQQLARSRGPLDEQDAVNSLSWIQEMLASKDRRPRVVSLRRLLEVLTPSLAS